MAELLLWLRSKFGGMDILVSNYARVCFVFNMYLSLKDFTLPVSMIWRNLT